MSLSFNNNFIAILLFAVSIDTCFAEINFDQLDSVKGNGKTESSFSGVVDQVNRTQSNLREEDSREREKAKAYRKEYNETHPPCPSRDECYDLTPTDSPSRVKVTCTYGSRTGDEREICSNDKGRWASGCGITDTFAHHYGLNEAARFVCDL